MANQMIALQARNPQLPDPARQTAQMANMMNMATQQRASQLQGERLRQEMAFEAAKEARAVETQAATMREKDLDIEDKEMVRLYKIGAALLETEDPTTREAGYQNLLGLIEKTSPQLGAAMRQVAGTFNPQVLQSVMMETEQYFNKKYATPVASLELSQGGLPRSVVVGGLNPEQRPVYDAPEAMAPAAAPRATPTAPQTNPMAAGATPRSADAEPGSLGLVVASALETGVMSKTDYDKMLSIAPPQSRAKIAAWAQQNNIEIVPDTPGITDNRMRGAAADFEASPMSYDGQTPQSQFAVFRGQPMQAQTAGLGGAPEMRQTLAQARTSTPLQMRNPNVSPLPGSSQVPLARVEAEGRAGRPSAQEIYDTELAKARAARDAAKITGPKPLTPVQEARLRDNIAKDYKSARSTISMMLDPIAGVVATVDRVRKLSPAQKEAITGYSGYLPSITPGARSADTAIKNLRGKVTEMGKSAAALTGAIGQMAVQEWRIVSDMIASLDIEGMEPADLDNQLDIIEAQARRAAEVTRDAYENQYVEEFARYPGRFQLPSATGKTPVVSRPKAESQLPRIRGNADYNRLKPGTEFIDPNGVRRRKPK